MKNVDLYLGPPLNLASRALVISRQTTAGGLASPTPFLTSTLAATTDRVTVQVPDNGNWVASLTDTKLSGVATPPDLVAFRTDKDYCPGPRSAEGRLVVLSVDTLSAVNDQGSQVVETAAGSGGGGGNNAPAPVFKDNWDPATTYHVADVVFSDDGLDHMVQCTAPNTNKNPASHTPSFWVNLPASICIGYNVGSILDSGALGDVSGGATTINVTTILNHTGYDSFAACDGQVLSSSADPAKSSRLSVALGDSGIQDGDHCFATAHSFVNGVDADHHSTESSALSSANCAYTDKSLACAGGQVGNGSVLTDHSVAIGGRVNGGVSYGVAVGQSVIVSASNAIAIGAGITNSTGNCVEIGYSDATKARFTATGLNVLGTLKAKSLIQPVATALTGAGALTVGADNPIDTSGGAFAVTYPDPSTWANQFIYLRDAAAAFATHNLTITHFGSTKLAGVVADYVCNAINSDGALYSDGTSVRVYGNLQTAKITSLVDNYGLLLADARQSFTLDANNAGTTVTIPLNATQAIPIGPDYAITFTNTSGGAWTFAKTGALTINGANANRTLAAATTGVYPTCSLWKKSADAWIMVGSGIT